MLKQPTRTWTSFQLHALGFALCAALVLVACPSSRQIVGAGGPDAVEDPLPPEAQAALDEAVTQMADGEVEAAHDTLDQITALYPDTRAAERADLLRLVIDLRDGRAPSAPERLIALAEDTDEDLSVRRTAAGYYALERAGAGDHPGAIARLTQLYPGNAPPPLVAPRDRQPLLMLLAEARRLQDDPAATFEALSWLYQLGDAQGQRFARTRGLELARDLAYDEAQGGSSLDPFRASPDDFIRGYTGAGYLLVRLDPATAGDSDANPEELAKLFDTISPILLRLTDTELAAELNNRLSAADGPDPLRVGALLPLTGPDRQVGQRALAGLLLAQGAFRSTTGGGLTLIIQDTQSAPLKAAEGLQLLADQGVVLVIGPLSNEEAAAAAVQAESASVPLVSLSLDPAVVDAGPNTFRLFIDSRREVESLITRAEAANAQKLAILYPDLPLGREMLAHAQKLTERSPMTIPLAVGYAPNATDFSKEARRVRASGADAIFIPDVGARVSLIMPYLAAEQLWCAPPRRSAPDGQTALLCLGNVTWLDGNLLQNTSAYVQGALVAASYATHAKTSENQRFIRLYTRQIGTNPDLFAAYAYNAMTLARTLVLDQGMTGRASARGALARLRDVRGLQGPLSNAGDGNIRHAPIMLNVTGKAFKLDTSEVAP